MKGLKLSNKQVEVLANKIYTELKEEANKYKETSEYINFEDTLKNTKEYKIHTKLTKIFSECAELDCKCNSFDYHSSYILGFYTNFVEKERNKAFKIPFIPSKETIENNIILNTIDTESLEDLINKVKDSLK